MPENPTGPPAPDQPEVTIDLVRDVRTAVKGDCHRAGPAAPVDVQAHLRHLPLGGDGPCPGGSVAR